MYILCDSVIRMTMKEKKVDFFQTLSKMRYQRDGVVSNVDQYIFCHFVLLEFYFPSSNASNNFVLEIQQGMQETAIKRLVDRLDDAVRQTRNDKDRGFMISEGRYTIFKYSDIKHCYISRCMQTTGPTT